MGYYLHLSDEETKVYQHPVAFSELYRYLVVDGWMEQEDGTSEVPTAPSFFLCAGMFVQLAIHPVLIFKSQQPMLSQMRERDPNDLLGSFQCQISITTLVLQPSENQSNNLGNVFSVPFHITLIGATITAFQWGPKHHTGLPGGSLVKNLLQCRRRVFNPRVRKIPCRRKWQPTSVFCLGNPMDREAWQPTVPGVSKESDTAW